VIYIGYNLDGVGSHVIKAPFRQSAGCLRTPKNPSFKDSFAPMNCVSLHDFNVLWGEIQHEHLASI